MSIFSPSEGTNKYMRILGINKYPFTDKELSAAFRIKIRSKHPDAGGTDSGARKIIEAKNALKNLTTDVLQKYDSSIAKKNEDIIGSTRKCSSCHGAGCKVFPGFKTCTSCEGTGKRKFVCKLCDNGEFTQINGRKVPCKSCKATGMKEVKCNKCRASGKEYVKNMHSNVCKNCNSHGRVKVDLFNPVIPFGAILTSSKKKTASVSSQD